MIIVGLTGSIGTGKSTTAQLFAKQGIPVNDADAVVHALYRGEAVAAIEEAFPGTTVDGEVDRGKLSAVLARNPAQFKRLEAIVHPLVRQKEQEFLASARRAGHEIVVLDIPLLFETGGEERVDDVVTVTCEPDLQRERVLARPGMTVEKFDLILSRQTPDADKRARADYVIETDHGVAAAELAVKAVLADLRRRHELPSSNSTGSDDA